MDHRFIKLIELGAGAFEHADASLIAHLEGTACLLKEWHANQVLQQAGLYYVIYSATSSELISNQQRQEMSAIVGKEVERIIYHLHLCEQNRMFQQLDSVSSDNFYHKLDQQQINIPEQMLQQVCEVYAASRLDRCIYQPKYAQQEKTALQSTFASLLAYLSPNAQRKIEFVLNG